MVWSILANGLVYVKYKNVYKIKLMVLNVQFVPASPCGFGHYTRFEALIGECHLPLSVNSSNVTARPFYTSSCSTITAIQGSCMVALRCYNVFLIWDQMFE